MSRNRPCARDSQPDQCCRRSDSHDRTRAARDDYGHKAQRSDPPRVERRAAIRERLCEQLKVGNGKNWRMVSRVTRRIFLPPGVSIANAV
jgi:hypothetical protein